MDTCIIWIHGQSAPGVLQSLLAASDGAASLLLFGAADAAPYLHMGFRSVKAVQCKSLTIHDFHVQQAVSFLTVSEDVGKHLRYILSETVKTNELAVRLAIATGGTSLLGAETLAVRGTESVCTRRVYGYNLVAETVIAAKPQCITVKPNAEAPPVRLAPCPCTTVTLPEEAPTWCTAPIRQAAPARNALVDAKLLMVAGRGIGGPDGVAEAKRTARAYHGALGCSRPPVLNGWMEADDLIGVSGVSVAPLLCFTFGISGMMPFLLGIEKASCIVAVNTDPNAAIFHNCDYAICEDCILFLQALRRLSGST